MGGDLQPYGDLWLGFSILPQMRALSQCVLSRLWERDSAPTTSIRWESTDYICKVMPSPRPSKVRKCENDRKYVVHCHGSRTACDRGWSGVILRWTICSGNLWFFDWVFAGVIMSSLKLRQKTFFLVHSAILENLRRPMCDKNIGIVFLCSA